MKPVNIVRKVKERKLFLLDSVKELDEFDFSSNVPNDARKPEITFKYNRTSGKFTLEIDYIISLEVKKIESE